MSYEICGWHFDPAVPVLRGVDGERPLEDRAARALALLCRRRDEVVSKDELIAEVWSGRTVSGNSVSIVMGSLRRALGDDPREPRIIVTIARRGYRLSKADGQDVDAVQETLGLPNRTRVRYVACLIAALVLIAVVATLLVLRPAKSTTLSVEPPRNETGQASLDPLAASLAPVVLHGVGRLPNTVLLDGGTAERSRVIVRSALILWNGAPELALRAIDTERHAVIWNGFASGPPALLARHVEERIAGLPPHLPR